MLTGILWAEVQGGTFFFMHVLPRIGAMAGAAETACLTPLLADRPPVMSVCFQAQEPLHFLPPFRGGDGGCFAWRQCRTIATKDRF